MAFHVGCQQQPLLLMAFFVMAWHSHQGALHKGTIETREYKKHALPDLLDEVVFLVS